MAEMWPRKLPPDPVDELSRLLERVRAVETGAHPVRSISGLAQTTPWFSLPKRTGWTGASSWRIASNVIQLRGTITGPGAWVTGDVAADVPADIIPAWPLTLVALSGAGKLIRVLIEASGAVKPYRDDIANTSVVLDPLRYQRG
jgi:hypothetical protein